MIRVGVIGAYGKMGREVCRAIVEDPDCVLVAAVDHERLRRGRRRRSSATPRFR